MPKEIELTNSRRCYACQAAIVLGRPECDYHERHPQKIEEYHLLEDPALD